LFKAKAAIVQLYHGQNMMRW